MGILYFLKRFCLIFLILMIAACGGSGGNSGGGSDDGDDDDDDDNNTTTSPNIVLSETSHNFGGIVLNNSSDRTFTITNDGTAALTIGTVSLSGSSFSIFTDGCTDETLAIDGTCSLTARFSPGDQGDFSGTLSIPSNDTDQSTATVGLTGEGYGLNVWINKIEATDCDVTVDVTVTDAVTGAIINGLDSSKFTLFEESAEISPTLSVSTTATISISVVLAIDWSASEFVDDAIMPEIPAAAKSFIDLLGAEDEAAACKFNGTIDFNPLPMFDTTDYSAVKAYIDDDFTGTRGTKLYDAVYDSIARAVQGSKEKKVVILLSDGADVAEGDVPPGSTHTLDEVIAYAYGQGIPIFTIYYGNPAYDGEDYGKPEVMERIAEETGGLYYNGTTDNLDLADIYQLISNTLSNKYTITYTSTNCVGAVPLDVRVDDDPLYGVDSGTIVR